MLFDQLPTEIFLQIFSFLRFQETITAFSNLNSYIDSVIRNINDGYLQVSYDNAEEVCCLNLYSHQIGRLTLIHSPSIDFTTSINLRSLTIKFGTIAQLNVIRPQYFPSLEILHICGVNYPSVEEKTKIVNDLFAIILSNGFPCLRICTATGIGVLESNRNWTGSSTIRLLILDGQAQAVDEIIASLCPNLHQPKCVLDIPFHSRMNTTMLETRSNVRHRRLLRDLMQLPTVEAEKKFIMDECSTGTVIQGRILPTSEPYCFASFRFEIKIPYNEYPFKQPEGRFLDPIYHPMVREGGKYCCCGGFYENWSPANSIADYITRVIYVIDNPLREDHSDCPSHKEYEKDYTNFQEKALRYIFQYGRPRF